MTDSKTKEYYSARAPEYEQIYYRDVPQRRAEITAESRRLEKLAERKNVLELACGTGYWTEIISRSAKSLVAVDYSEEMLFEAKKKEYHSKVEFIRDDLYNLKLSKHDFDLVVLGFWFSHHPKKSYDKLFSILKSRISKDGLIWMIDNNPPAEGSQTDQSDIDPYNDNLKIRYLSDGRAYEIIKNYFSMEDLMKILGSSFDIFSLIHNKYYWSAVLSQKS